MYSNKYRHNIHKFCIIKVQGGEHIFRKNVNNREPPSLPNCVKMDNLKLTATRLYESYFRDTK